LDRGSGNRELGGIRWGHGPQSLTPCIAFTEVRGQKLHVHIGHAFRAELGGGFLPGQAQDVSLLVDPRDHRTGEVRDRDRVHATRGHRGAADPAPAVERQPAGVEVAGPPGLAQRLLVEHGRVHRIDQWNGTLTRGHHDRPHVGAPKEVDLDAITYEACHHVRRLGRSGVGCRGPPPGLDPFDGPVRTEQSFVGGDPRHRASEQQGAIKRAGRADVLIDGDRVLAQGGHERTVLRLGLGLAGDAGQRREYEEWKPPHVDLRNLG